MLSRRNIRIKVMQVLYSMSRDRELTTGDALQRYQRSVDLSYELYLYSLLFFMHIADYAKQDKRKKSAKLRPTEADKKFTAKLSTNALMTALRDNQALKEIFSKYKLKDRIDSDTVRLIYTDFAATDEYQKYMAEGETSTNASHKQILLDLFKHCINSERYTDSIEDHYPFWSDDKSLVVGAVKRSIKALPDEENFFNAHRPHFRNGQRLWRNAPPQSWQRKCTPPRRNRTHPQKLGRRTRCRYRHDPSQNGPLRAHEFSHHSHQGNPQRIC